MWQCRCNAVRPQNDTPVTIDTKTPRAAFPEHRRSHTFPRGSDRGRAIVRTMKSLAWGVAAVAAIGAAAAGATAIAGPPAEYQVQPVVFGAPLPLDPAPVPAPANLPTAPQLTGILTNLADPNVSFVNKGNLVEGGIGGTEARLADHQLNEGGQERSAAPAVQHRQHPAGRRAGLGHGRRRRLRPQAFDAGHAEHHLRQSGRLGAVAEFGDAAAAGGLGLTLRHVRRLSRASRSGSASTSIAAIRPARTRNPITATARPAMNTTAPAAPLTTAVRTSRSGPA